MRKRDAEIACRPDTSKLAPSRKSHRGILRKYGGEVEGMDGINPEADAPWAMPETLCS